MTRFTVSGLLIFVLALASSPAAAAESHKLEPLISVTGEGRATSPPNKATIRTGVVTEAEAADAALEQNTAAMKKIIDVLKQQGIAEKDVQTSSFNVSPVYKHDERGGEAPKITGYRVQNEVSVEVRELASLGGVLDALVQAGSNQISGISFDIEDPTDVLNVARRRAIQNAISRAEVYAEAAGVEVGQAVQIQEQAGQGPPQPMQFGLQMRGAASSVPVATGEQELTAHVNVVFRLEQSGDK